MATLQIGLFGGQVPLLDAPILPDRNAQVALDCWFVNGVLEPIKTSGDNGATAWGVSTKTLYRHRPCPSDSSQAYWIEAVNAYDVAPSPVANDNFGRVFFADRNGLDAPRFADVKGVINGGIDSGWSGTNPCSGPGAGVSSFTVKWKLGVPAPGRPAASVQDNWSALAWSGDGLAWNGPTGFSTAGLSFKTVFQSGSSLWLAGGPRGQILWATDGASWSAASLSADAQALNATVLCFAYSGSGYVAGLSGGRLLYSDDGMTWNLNATVKLGQDIKAAIFFAGLFWLAGVRGVTQKAASHTGPWSASSALSTAFGSQDINAGAVYSTACAYFVGSNGTIVTGVYAGGSVTWAKAGAGAFPATSEELLGVEVSPVPMSGRENLSVLSAHRVWICTTPAGVAPLTGASRLTNVDSIESNPSLRTIFGSTGDTLTALTYNSAGYRTLVGTGGKVAVEGVHAAGVNDTSTFSGASSLQNFSAANLNAITWAYGRYVAAGDAVSGSTTDTRYYVVTFVDAYGAESTPSAPSNQVIVQTNQPVSLSWAPPDSLSEVNTTGAYYYVYRTNTSASATEFQFVAQVAYTAGTMSYTDSVATADLAEVLPSTDWALPPSNLRGLVSTPGGVLAGFYNNTLCFSEPGQPHAWPVKYQRVVDYPVVGLHVFGNSLLVATTGQPYLVEGIDPANMAVTKIPGAHACISRLSIVDMGGRIVYATANGLVSVSSTGVEALTDKLFTRDQWQQLNPASLQAVNWDGQYLAFFTGSGGYIPAGAQSLALNPEDAAQGVAFYTESGVCPYRDPLDGTVYYVNGSGTRASWNRGSTRKTLRWRSKQYQTPSFVNFSFAQVMSTAYPVTFRYFVEEAPASYQQLTFLDDYSSTTLGSTVEHRDYVNGAQFGATKTYSVSSTTARLRAGQLSRWHTIELEASGKFWQATLAQSSNELREAT